MTSPQPELPGSASAEPAFRILTLGPADSIQYYAACSACTYLSMPFDTPARATWAAERHEWERHAASTPAKETVLPQAG